MKVKRKKKNHSRLRIGCSQTDCQKGLHFFRPNKESIKLDKVGDCLECGADLVQWERLHKRDFKDVEYTVQALNLEFARNTMWNLKIEDDDKAVNYAKRKGKIKLDETVDKRISSSIGNVPNDWDGRQTPRGGNPIFYAQHATGTCCRRCAEYWHGVPRDRALVPSEKQYFSNLVKHYLGKKLPWLKDAGAIIPRHKAE
jgi:hypothetical protein